MMLKLERQFGLCGVVLDWFRSYLRGRTYRVIHGGKTSYIVHVICSVPQGSVLGPRMFILHAADFEDVAAKHSVNIHGYADDTHLYLHGRPDDITSTIDRLESCIADVGQWMSANRLNLNTEKAELLWAGSRHGQPYRTGCGPHLQLGADTVTAQDNVHLLGVTISSDCSLQRHVSNVSTTSFNWLHQLRRVRRSLDSSQPLHSSMRS